MARAKEISSEDIKRRIAELKREVDGLYQQRKSLGENGTDDLLKDARKKEAVIEALEELIAD